MRSAYVVRQPVVNSYLVRERDRRRLVELMLVVATAVPLVLALIAYVWLNLELLRLGYRIHHLESQLQQSRHELQLLELEESYQTGAARLEAVGRQLGLAPPGEGQQVRLGAEP